MSTLKYANRAKSIENAVVRNEDMNERMIKDLKQEVERLKQQLESGAGAGGGTGTGGLQSQADKDVYERLHRLEESQRTAWDEKERLSRALEQERQANMHTVISTMMAGVQEQKVNKMKLIRKFNNIKSNLTKKFKELRDGHAVAKIILDQNMIIYQKFQVNYDVINPDLSDNEMEKVKGVIESKMSELLPIIEKDRAAFMKQRETIKHIKDQLQEVEEQLDEERAGLEATAGLLDQNDKLRSEIQNEERELAKIMIETELATAREGLEKEREKVRGTIEGELARELEALNATIVVAHTQLRLQGIKLDEASARGNQLQEYVDSLEGRLANAEVDEETALQELAELKKQFLSSNIKHGKELLESNQLYDIEIKKNDVLENLVNSLRAAAAEFENEKKSLVLEFSETQKLFEEQMICNKKLEEEKSFHLLDALVEGMQAEKKILTLKYSESQQLLAIASKDILFLALRNEKLEAVLHDSVYGETPIKPSLPTLVYDKNRKGTNYAFL